jgi:hypothetical protein
MRRRRVSSLGVISTKANGCECERGVYSWCRMHKLDAMCSDRVFIALTRQKGYHLVHRKMSVQVEALYLVGFHLVVAAQVL